LAGDDILVDESCQRLLSRAERRRAFLDVFEELSDVLG
jgi:hypothetical protein